MMASLWPVDDCDSKDFCLTEFLQSPLVHWALSLSGHHQCNNDNQEQQLISTEISCNSIHFLKDLLDQIEPNLLSSDVTAWQDDPVLHRLTVLESLTNNLDAYFTDHLGQMMILRPPDLLLLSQYPATDGSFNELRKLLLVILSLAVQSGRKEEIISRIQNMEEDVQKGIVDCIKEVMHNPSRVWKVELSDLLMDTPLTDHDHDRQLLLLAHQHIRTLLADRHHLIKLAVVQWRESRELKAAVTSGGGGGGGLTTTGQVVATGASQAVEVADLKTQIRRVTQELYECQEELRECKDELTVTNSSLECLKEEHGHLEKESRLVKVYRDELDLLYEKDKNSQKLESELSRYRSQLVELEYYKNRIEELEQNWKLLTETKNLLENQLESARKRTEVIPQLENEMSIMRHDLQNAVLQINLHRDQVADLLVANTQLSLELKRYQRSLDAGPFNSGDGTMDDPAGLGISLSDQLHESLSSKVLRLEMENEQLRATTSDGCADQRHSTSSCRHCLMDKDSAVGTVPTSEDTCSTGDSSIEIDHEQRHLDSDAGYDGVDFATTATDSAPIRHLKSTEFLLNHVFDSVPASLRDENARLKEEIEVLQTLVQKQNRQTENVLSSEETSQGNLVIRQTPRQEEPVQVCDRCPQIQQTVAELEESKRTLEEMLVLEKECFDDICAFLRQNNVSDFPSEIVAACDRQRGQRVCDQIASLLSRRKKETIEHSHVDMMKELQSLKSEHDVLRNVHQNDVRRLEMEHDTLKSNHRRDTEALQRETERTRSAEDKIQQLQEELGKKGSLLVNQRIEHNQALGTLRAEYETQRKTAAAVNGTATSCGADESPLRFTNIRLENEIRCLKLTNSALEEALREQDSVKENLVRTVEASQVAHGSVMADHESLQHYHGQLSCDYEKLCKEMSRVKYENKRLVLDLDKAKKKIHEAVTRERNELALTKENELLRKKEEDYEKMLSENESLRNTNRQLGTTYQILTEEHKTVKTEVSQLKLKKIEFEGIVYDCQNEVQNKELEATKHTEILLGIIASLEDEKRSFAAAIERLLLQYDDVFLHSWREKNEMKSEHRELQDKLRALDLQKQLLIQKLYDTCKATEARKQSNSFMKRVRQLVGRSRSRGQSRSRAISPSDSAADSSSVESNDQHKSGKARQSPSLHSLRRGQTGRDKVKDFHHRDSQGIALSYSSDDLHKINSSASSSCISPAHDTPALVASPGNHNPTFSSVKDAAFHRVGSRRGVYQSPSSQGMAAAVVVHHPALPRDSSSPSAFFLTPKESSTPDSSVSLPSGRKTSVGDSVSKSSGDGANKACCTSYGGFHDCSMLNYTRLSATTGLTSGQGRRGSLISGRRTVDEWGRMDGYRSSQSSSSTQHDLTISRASPRAALNQPSFPNTSMTSTPVRTLSREVIYAQPRQVTSKARSMESPLGEAGVITADDKSTPSSWSFSASFSYPRPGQTTTTTTTNVTSSNSYYQSDGPAPSPGDHAVLGRANLVEDNQVWYEYGCV